MVTTERRYFPTSLLLVRRAGDWLGVAIEIGVTVDAPSAAEALLRLVDATATAVCAEAAGVGPAEWGPAEPWWEMFHDVIVNGASSDRFEDFEQVALPSLFVVDVGDHGVTWRQMPGTPMCAALQHPHARQLVARVATTV